LRPNNLYGSAPMPPKHPDPEDKYAMAASLSLTGRVLLSPARAARVIDVTPKTLLKWVEAGEFPRPVTLPGNDLRWHKIVVVAWTIQREQDGTLSVLKKS